VVKSGAALRTQRRSFDQRQLARRQGPDMSDLNSRCIIGIQQR
jgi:hypothetical protein